MRSSHSLAVAGLATWLLAELLGAYMLRNWVTSGAARRRHEQPDGLSLPVLLGHAGLNLAGLSCWVAFVLTRSAVAGWLAICLLVPAIGLGVSTVSVWTPYPVRRSRDAGQSAGEERLSTTAIGDRELARSLDDEELAGRLVDDLLARNIAIEAQHPNVLAPDPRAIVPLAHGVLAIATFLLAVLAAIGAS